DGDATVMENLRRVNASEFDLTILDNLPLVFVDSAPNLVFVDSDGKQFGYAQPILKSIIKGSNADGDPITGDLFIRAVALYNANVQLTGVQEFGIQKKDLSGHLLWIDLKGRESVDPAATGIPVIIRTRSSTPGAALVWLTDKGNRVFTNTHVP